MVKGLANQAQLCGVHLRRAHMNRMRSERGEDKRRKGEGRGAQVAGSTPTRLALSQIDAMNYQAVTLFPSKVYPTAAEARPSAITFKKFFLAQHR
jgi:hypothetical protein